MPKNVLLVGAFANGNIGDMLQADSIAQAVLEVAPDAAVASVSPSRRAQPYPASNHAALPSEQLWDLDVINAFDLVLVGGGGLLAAPHAPLHEDEWVKGITTRLCALSLGCASEPAQQARTFVRQCYRFAARDEYSAAQVAGVRKDVDIVMDPILLARRAAGVPAPANGAREGVACVAGKLLTQTRPFYESLERDLLKEGDVIVSINEATDRRSGFDEVFRRDVAYVGAADDLHALLAPRRLSVSERYHGCILSLRAGVPCFGIVLRSATVTSKITELYRVLGLSEHLIADGQGLDRDRLVLAAAEGFDFAAIERTLDVERVRLHDYLRTCLA